MRVYLLFIWTLIIVLFCQTIDAQKVILLQKPGKTKRFMYETGDKITVRMGSPEFLAGGEITYIDDSLCIVNKNFTIPFANVKEVKITRHFLYGAWRMMFLASAVYAGGSMLNRALHSDKPLIDNTIPIASGSFIALGATSYLLRYKHCKMKDGWKLKVLDYDIFKEKNKARQ